MKQQINTLESDNFIRVTAHLLAVVEKSEDVEGVYVAHCPVLDVSSQGDSKENALDMLSEAVQLFLESCYEMNTLDDVLNECGFVKSEHVIQTAANDQHDHIEVPLDLVIAREMGLVSKSASC